jgi:hypothetical protein
VACVAYNAAKGWSVEPGEYQVIGGRHSMGRLLLHVADEPVHIRIDHQQTLQW